MGRRISNKKNETRVMNNGMKAAIIAYRGYKDIDIQFEDGYIVKNTSYERFAKGTIKNRNIDAKKYLNETRIMNNGMKATIIAYRKYADIDIQFEDEFIRTNVNYDNFKTGHIQHPLKSKKHIMEKRLGETRVMNNGMKATIIAYRKYADIDIQFEDEFIRTNVSYKSFKTGHIQHSMKKHLDETRIMNNGMKATIIAYRKNNDIDVKFEDDAISKNKSYGSFIRGQIGHPTRNKKQIKKKRLGETRVMNNGMKATIIAYRTSKDIDVQFKDGTIVTNRFYRAFVKGQIKNPNSSKHKKPE